MQRPDNFRNLSNQIMSAIGLLELDRDSSLRKETISICDYLDNPNFRIAVFGPFNYGKSTLLNALLGDRTLPIDIIPTTGAAIHIRYGEQILTKIVLQDGKKINSEGTDILKEYALLDDRRCMREDVKSIEVRYPHPFLQTGVEFLDLPGTNDRETQDDLVKDKLLTADLIVQVLDARQLMTLSERENLRDWLLDRGINTVVFVVNFLNLLAEDEQKEVYSRLRFVAESFRSELPAGLSNLYRVDALPALRARLKGDVPTAHTTGLIVFESALQSMIQNQQDRLNIKLPRLLAITEKIYQVGEEKKHFLLDQLATEKQKQESQNRIRAQAKKLIGQSFQRSISDFQSWLYSTNILSKYQADLAIAIQENRFDRWQTEEFQKTVFKYQQEIEEWVTKACDFFELENPGKLAIDFPILPDIETNRVDRNETNVNSSNVDRTTENKDDNLVSVAIPTGIGWILGGPVGAAVLGGASYILNKAATRSTESVTTSNEKVNNLQDTTRKSKSQVYVDAAEAYLIQFSDRTFAILNEYEQKAEKVIDFQPKEICLDNTMANHQLKLLNNLLDNLKQELERLKQP